ncbi:hypothetical protein V8D89_016235, partial [Ganoderma adspersum]
SSAWATSGHSDPSVNPHPPSSWYLWFSTTPAPAADPSVDCLVPHQPKLHPDPGNPIPYAFPSYVAQFLGADGYRSESTRIERVKNGLEVIPAGEEETPYSEHLLASLGDLGGWGTFKITTLLQAHNLRLRALNDRDLAAAQLYHHLVDWHQSNPTQRRSEGVLYLMEAFVND